MRGALRPYSLRQEMADRLPPDLSRLGDELTTAAATRLQTRARRAERRWRLATRGIAGALVFAALTPSALAPSVRAPFGSLASVQTPPGCDQPRGARFAMTGCSEAMVLYRPYAVR
jgi:hypothetical protein